MIGIRSKQSGLFCGKQSPTYAMFSDELLAERRSVFNDTGTCWKAERYCKVFRAPSEVWRILVLVVGDKRQNHFTRYEAVDLASGRACPLDEYLRTGTVVQG